MVKCCFSIISYITFAVSAVGLGLAIFSTEFSRFSNLTIFWVYIGYIASALILHLIMYGILKSCSRPAAKNNHGDYELKAAKLPEGKAVEMTAQKEEEGEVKEEEEEKKKEEDKGNTEVLGLVNENDEAKKEAPDSPCRWTFLAMFVAITVPSVITLIVLVALPAA